MNKYPNISQRYEAPTGGLCKICGNVRANYRIVVQVSHMRGDDEVYKVHLMCMRRKRDSALLEILIKDSPAHAPH